MQVLAEGDLTKRPRRRAAELGNAADAMLRTTDDHDKQHAPGTEPA